MLEEIKSPADLLGIFKRRLSLFLVPALSVFVIMIIIALVLPPEYRSTSTILIEEQEIPRDYVVSTVTGYAEQRLQIITQRILGATRLLEIINTHGLYAEYRKKHTSEETIKQMKEDIALETINADVIDPRTGRPSAATIAFTLSYSGESPGTVQKIANVLTSLYLEESLRVREAQTQGASKFLDTEVKDVKAHLDDIDARISSYKSQNLDALPELNQFNLQMLDRTERDIDQTNGQLRTLREQEGYLQAQLAAMSDYEEDADKARLNELRLQLGSLKTRVSDEYPDVRRIKQEIADLEKRLENQDERRPGKPDNPSYITMAAQLASVRTDIEGAKVQLQDFIRKRDELRGRIEAGPGVEESYKALLIERENYQLKYRDLNGKYMEAKVAEGLEQEQMGERFTLVEPARLPEKPVSPNRPVIIALGLILGIALGAGLVVLREAGDFSVRDPEALTRLTGFPVLVSVPEIMTVDDLAGKRRRRIVIAAGIAVGLILCICIFHFFIMDLDVFWAKLARRLDLMW